MEFTSQRPRIDARRDWTRVLLISPGSVYAELCVHSESALKVIIGCDGLETRPFTTTKPYLAVAMDDSFVHKGLAPSLYHPTYRESYLLRGPLVVYRTDEEGGFYGLTDDDVKRAIAIITEFSVHSVR